MQCWLFFASLCLAMYSFGRGYLLRSYRLKPRRHLSRLKDASVPSLESSMTSPPELLTKLSSLLCCKDNTTKTLENIVEFGRAADLDSLDKHRDLFQKIRNCNAGSIAVWTQLSGDHNIRVFGTADSLVTKGVLAVIAEGLRALSAQAITDRFTEEVLNLPLFSQLSVLRRSGLEQLLNTIVLQIKSQVISFGVPPLHAKRPEELYVTHQGSSVAVLLSGGVDSSLALSLLKEKGENVQAFYLKIWLEDEENNLRNCPWEEDLRYASEVCSRLDVPLNVLSLQEEYKEKIIDYVVSETKQDRTPNPDVMCNNFIKFGIFADRIGSDYDRIATGHYALKCKGIDRLTPSTQHLFEDEEYENSYLLRATDKLKDQTYFLSHISQTQLKKAEFPIGHLLKSDVRKMAFERQLSSANRKDSQGLCFIGKLKYVDFMSRYIPEAEGPIIDINSGISLGQHKGLWSFTIGQHRGIGSLLYEGHNSEKRWWVVRKDSMRNALVVTDRINDVITKNQKLNLKNIRWLSGIPSALKAGQASKIKVEMKLMHSPVTMSAELYNMKTENENLDTNVLNSMEVRILEDSRIASPGQFAVFYSDEVCLGSGIIH